MLTMIICSPMVPVVQWSAHLLARWRSQMPIPVGCCYQTNFILHKIIFYVKLT